MKFLAHLIAVLLLSWVLQSFLPWWTMAVGAFATGLFFRQSGFQSFLAGLLGVGLLWFLMAWYSDASTSSILSEKVAGIFPTKTVGLLRLVTAFIGGLVGGLASMTGGIISYRRRVKY
ncbi:MAG TPA: hypothetical protein VK508_03535 [Cyclobacteriaceae bacterium]|nr:hypothetical protein [Cyclobacteriaceae bacterium]